MKSFAIIGLIIVFLILSGCSNDSNKEYTKNRMYLGSNLKWIDFEDCGEQGQFVIEQKNFSEIRSCLQKELIINDKNVWLVKIEYGPGSDCQAGCFYERFLGIVDEDNIYEIRAEVPSLGSNFIHQVCGYDMNIVKYKDAYKWAVQFNGSPGGQAVYLGNETIPEYESTYMYEDWDTTNLTVNDYTNPYKCNGRCLYYSYQTMKFNDFLGFGGDKLLNEVETDTSHLRNANTRLTSKEKCINNKIVVDVEILDNEYHCTHRFYIYLDGSDGEYLGCEPEKFLFTNISADKTEANVNEDIQLTITSFPKEMEICNPYLTIFYMIKPEMYTGPPRTQFIKKISDLDYYTDYNGKKVYISEGTTVLLPEQFKIGCKTDNEFILSKSIKFTEKGEYLVYARINEFGTNKLNIIIT